jgi:hypothetical protein
MTTEERNIDFTSCLSMSIHPWKALGIRNARKHWYEYVEGEDSVG